MRFYFNDLHEEAAVWDDDRLKQDFNYDCDYASDASIAWLKIAI